MTTTPEKTFEEYFGKTPVELALKVISKEKEDLLSDCNTWLSDLEIIDERYNEHIKKELDSKIDRMYNLMLDQIEQEIQRVYSYASFEDFINEYFVFRSAEYKIANQLISLHEQDNENFKKVSQYAKDNKELFIQLLKALE